MKERLVIRAHALMNTSENVLHSWSLARPSLAALYCVGGEGVGQ